MTMTDWMQPDLSALDEDGDTVGLADGRTLRLSILVDQDSQVTDFGPEAYGSFAWPDEYRDRNTGQPRRPDGFDGNAEKLNTISGPIWWQPSPDSPLQRGTQEWSDFRTFLGDLISFGFKGVRLEILEGEDAYGRAIVRAEASLWGIDTLDTHAYTDAEGVHHPFVRNGYLTEIVRELAAELDLI